MFTFITRFIFVSLFISLIPSAAVATVSPEYREPRLPVVKLVGPDPVAGYEPQVSCRSTPLPGTAMLHSWLLNNNPGTYSSGMIRDCGTGGTSEHKDGRAIDWGADVRTQVGRAAGYGTIESWLATDEDGNKAALARRMGIMYFIYDDKIWSSYYDFKPRPYLHPACSSVKACSPTLRHLDHVHISLSRAGGLGQTSWYLDRGIKRQAVYQPGTSILDTASTAAVSFKVPANGEKYVTDFKIAQGEQVLLVADGAVRTGANDHIADAVCHWDTLLGAWVRNVDKNHGLIANNGVPWSTSCAGDTSGFYNSVAEHTHVGAWTAPKTRKLVFQFKDADPARNDGFFWVHVVRPDVNLSSLVSIRPTRNPTPAPVRGGAVTTQEISSEGVFVPATDRLGVFTSGSLVAGQTYGLIIRGQGNASGRVFDAGCVSWRERMRIQHTLDVFEPAGDHLSLRIDGVSPTLVPTSPAAPGSLCASADNREYVGEFVATKSGPARVRVFDPYLYSDNDGGFAVQFTKIVPPVTE